jgi:beta-N-acetylhexosaminidase
LIILESFMHAPLIIDVAGFTLTTAERQRLAHPLVGGVILFGRNWQSRDQLATLCRQIKSVRPDLLIAVDHEGGRVQRFRTDGFTHLPPMAALGSMWNTPDKKKDLPGTAALRASRAATAAGYVLGAELRACGVDLSFTPVLDLDHGDSSVIGDRSFHRDPRVVSILAQALMLGLQQSGMGNCGKHFPGHGFVKADSHVAIPVDKRSLKKILKDDAAPFGWLSAGLTAVMPAHVIYPKVDSRPAGFSELWLQEVLRHQLGFTGAVFSDDLSMEAARYIDGRPVSFTEAALAALRAGADMVLLCNQSVVDQGAPIDEAIDALSRVVLEGEWALNPASEERRLALLPRDRAMDWGSLMVSERYMHALSLLP